MHIPIVRKFEKRKVYSSFKDNIWGVSLADMQLISKYNKLLHFSCVIDVYSKYAWTVPLQVKIKKSITITKSFQKVLNESRH